MVQIVPKYQGALALCNSTTYFPITKVHFVQYSGTMVQIVPKYQGALCTLGTMLEHLHCTIVQLISQLPRCTLYSTVVQ